MNKLTYDELNKQLTALLDGETDTIANLANSSALLYQHIENINWLGFYLVKGEELVLGPFQGRPACVRIPLGKGVCGTAAEQKQSIVVADVHQFEGHIACDIRSRSEIVLPLIVNGELFGVLDIDSPVVDRFDQNDKIHLEKLVDIIRVAIQ